MLISNGLALQEMNLREQQFALLRRISLPIWVFDIDRSEVHWANEAALTLWRAASLDELCSRDMAADMSASVAKRLRQYQSDFVQHGASFSEQWTIYPAGIPVSMNMQLSGIRLSDGRMAMLCESRVIEPGKPEAMRSVEALLHTDVMITLYDLEGGVLYRNPAARESVPNLNMRMAERFQDGDALERMLTMLELHGEATLTLPAYTTRNLRWHEVSVRQCRDAVTGRNAVLMSEMDVTAIKHAQDHSQFLARHDALTGLPNRSHVMQRFADALRVMDDGAAQAALIYIDLDHFKDINDTLGHAAGDDLLVQVADRLRGITRSSDMVARLGGDEFLILMVAPNIREEVEQIRERLSLTVARPIHIQGTEVIVTPSVGVSFYPEHGLELETLLRNADLAMYSAKESGRNALNIFESPMAFRVQQRMELEAELRHALARQEFELYYQPRVDVATGQVRGAEALIRWNHPQRGLVGPDAFIPTCESTGMINALGDWVFEQAARQQVQWAREGLDLKISVNLSPRQFRDPELLNRLARIVTATAAQPGRLELELTESMLLGVAPHTHETLDDLRRMGFSISVDDFGTGYSNLAYLNRFPIQVLKVDKTFVQDIEANRPVAELIVSMCRLMQLHIVAEGVETPAQLEWVQTQGIGQYQGYLFAKPLPATAFVERVRA
ncbi:COG5001 Predicted signal transduction protein containing a membrane domain, an EAL and a GGDEF domain [Comamonadaceae bacterium]